MKVSELAFMQGVCESSHIPGPRVHSNLSRRSLRLNDSHHRAPPCIPQRPRYRGMHPMTDWE